MRGSGAAAASVTGGLPPIGRGQAAAPCAELPPRNPAWLAVNAPPGRFTIPAQHVAIPRENG
jgi:hypothetical protein